MTTMHRAEYMRAPTEVNHRRFYAGILELAGIKMRADSYFVAKCRGLEYPYDNGGLSLATWDRQGMSYREAMYWAFEAVGDHLSPAGVVCALKEAVRQQLEREDADRAGLIQATKDADPRDTRPVSMFLKAGTIALLREPEVFMRAVANDEPHFTEYAARVVYDGIVDAVVPEIESHCQFLAAFVAGNKRPADIGLVRDICAAVHYAITHPTTEEKQP